ncbi:MAG: GNAT family N-acetyltransferase [Terriglobales bacterium]
MPASTLRNQAAAVRGFSRFYTQQLGILKTKPFAADLPLAAARVVYELSCQPEITPAALAARLAMDAGQLSRLLADLRRRRLLRETPASDRRSKLVGLSPAGRRLFRSLDRFSQTQAEGFLRPLAPTQRDKLIHSLEAAQRLLGGEPAPHRTASAVRLRPPRPGDMGWITHRQAVLYATEYGWTSEFEGLVAEIVGAFLQAHDPSRERCWIAESGGAIVGSIFLVRESDAVAKLRLLYVEPATRGQGVGRKLVAACIAFARQAGYQTITLYTTDVLISARRIYQAAGLQLVKEWRHHIYGKDLTLQTWNLDFTQA